MSLVVAEEYLVPRRRITRAAGDILPEGTAPPSDIPTEIFSAGLACYLEMRRLDMRSLAGELGMGRATLYRKVKSRDHLLGEVMWYLTRRLVLRALRDTAMLRGRARISTVIELFNDSVSQQVELRHLLDSEPEAALRILTSKHGPVQAGLVGVIERLLDAEAEFDRSDSMNAATLAYVIVRIGESFLYADVIGHGEPDPAAAMQIIDRLLDATVADTERFAAWVGSGR